MASPNNCKVCNGNFSYVLRKKDLLYKPLSPSFILCQSCLGRSKFKNLTTIRTVVHYDEYTNACCTDRLPSFPMDNDDMTFFGNEALNVLFYSPSGNNENHSYYGNVAFDLNFQEALKRFPNLFFIENIAYKKSICSRILMTRRDVSVLKELFPGKKFIPLPCDGASLLTLEGGTYKIISELPSQTSCTYYNIDFVIDCNERKIDEKWIFKKSKISAVDHSDINRRLNEWDNDEELDIPYRPRSCHSINNPHKSRTPALLCPIPFGLEDCKNRVEEFQEDMEIYDD